MNLQYKWAGPNPIPSCGFKILYRTKSAANYTELDTSGSTSGNTIAIPITMFGCYEGIVQANCCNSNVSVGIPYGE